MPCFHPAQAYVLLGKVSPTGKKVIVWSQKAVGKKPHEVIPVKCGQCIGCRVSKSIEWGVRCVHESSLYGGGADNCYITLTFNDETLDGRRTLLKSDFQNFIKRLRKNYHGINTILSPKGKYHKPIRYFHCGEYGSICERCQMSEHYCLQKGCGSFVKSLGRPHYHACLFNFAFSDMYYWCSRRGNKLYRSETLERTWSHEISTGEIRRHKPENVFERHGKLYAKNGFCTIGQVTFKSAAYIARYCTKKITGDRSDAHYRVIDRQTGEIQAVMPEYATSSNRQGLGAGWYNRYGFRDCFPSDTITVSGRQHPVPGYYFTLLERSDPNLAQQIKNKRVLTAKENRGDNTPERLRVRKKCFTSKVTNQLERSYENDNGNVCST